MTELHGLLLRRRRRAEMSPAFQRHYAYGAWHANHAKLVIHGLVFRIVITIMRSIMINMLNLTPVVIVVIIIIVIIPSNL